MTQTMSPKLSPSPDQHQGLSPSEIESYKKAFAEDGYIVIKNVISQERLVRLQQRLEEEFEKAKQTGKLFAGGGMMSGHLNCFPGEESRFIYETLEQKGFIDLIRAISPKVKGMPNVGCNFNLPGSVAQHYHTDYPFSKEFMIANIAVVDTVIENGAMQLVPGSHKKYYPYWRFVLEGLERKSIRLPMDRGDLVIRTSSTWHRGMPNRTAKARPMVALTWEAGGSAAPDPFQVEDGKITFRPNWFRPTKLGRIRERMFVTAPVTYSAYRFVTSLYDNKQA